MLLKQLNKWRGSESSPTETKITVPKSGGLAIFTHHSYSEGPHLGLIEETATEMQVFLNLVNFLCVVLIISYFGLGSLSNQMHTIIIRMYGIQMLIPVFIAS